MNGSTETDHFSLQYKQLASYLTSTFLETICFLPLSPPPVGLHCEATFFLTDETGPFTADCDLHLETLHFPFLTLTLLTTRFSWLFSFVW